MCRKRYWGHGQTAYSPRTLASLHTSGPRLRLFGGLIGHRLWEISTGTEAITVEQAEEACEFAVRRVGDLFLAPELRALSLSVDARRLPPRRLSAQGNHRADATADVLDQPQPVAEETDVGEDKLAARRCAS